MGRLRGRRGHRLRGSVRRGPRFREDGKRERACRVKVDMLRGWVIPVIEEHARRYGCVQ
jgi:hypothetical protein